MNIKNILVGLSALAVAAVPALSSAHEVSADVSGKTDVGLHLGEFFRDFGRVSARTVDGTVSAISGNGFTLNTAGDGAVNVQTNANTKFNMKGVASASLANVAVGADVAAKGTWDAAHTVFTAAKVTIQAKLNPIRDWWLNLFASHVVNGKVTAVSGNTLTVQSASGTVYSVNASSAKVYTHGSTSATISDVKVGDRVQVLGNVSGTSVSADIVHDISAK